MGLIEKIRKRNLGSAETRATMIVESDAWSDGQVRSKLWLAKAIEDLHPNLDRPLNLWILGSWYGLAAQVMLMRERLKFSEIHLFDLDSKCELITHKLLNHWICQGLPIRFHLQDCEKLSEFTEGGVPDVVVNTSCEHFETYKWIEGIPAGVLIVAQSTNMRHPTHILTPTSLMAFRTHLEALVQVEFAGELKFEYPDKSFQRFMVVGRKKSD